MLVPLEFSPDSRRVHYSFYYSFCNSWKDLLCYLEKNAKKQKSKIEDFNFYHTGNSMGEAIIKIAALYMSKIIVATFTNPGVFDLTDSKSYSRSLSNRTVRAAKNNYDQVLVVAPAIFSRARIEEQLRVLVESYTLHKRGSYYQYINIINESDFQLENNTSIFYLLPPNRIGLILANSVILSNIQFLKCFLYQEILSVGSCTEKNSEIVSYKMNSILVKASNSLSFIYINRQFKDTKICKIYCLHYVPYMMDFGLGNGISILGFPIEGLTTINSLIMVKSLIDTSFNSKNDALFKREARLAIKCNMLSCKNNKLPIVIVYKSNKKELSLSNKGNTKDVSKIDNTIEDLDFVEQRENSLFDDISFNLDDKKEQFIEISITQGNDLSNKSLELEANDSKDEYNEAQQTINAYNEDGFTLLHLAAQKGDVKEGKRLIQLKADIEVTSKTKDGCDTALHLAAQKGYSSFVELLLRSGADVNKTSATGSGVTPLHEAAYYGHINVIRLLIACNAIIDAKDRNGYSPLQYACSNGKLNSVQLLLKEGANPYLQNNNGETSLFDAVCFGYFEIVSILISTTVNKENYINMQNGYGKTVLHAVACKQAISKTHKNTIELLLKNGADPNLKDKLGQSPLYIAKKHNNKELISLFSLQSTKKSKLLPIVVASILLTLVVSLGVAISIYLEILVVGIVVGVCLILSATAVFSYCHNSQAIRPESSLETTINTSSLKKEIMFVKPPLIKEDYLPKPIS